MINTICMIYTSCKSRDWSTNRIELPNIEKKTQVQGHTVVLGQNIRYTRKRRQLNLLKKCLDRLCAVYEINFD